MQPTGLMFLVQIMDQTKMSKIALYIFLIQKLLKAAKKLICEPKEEKVIVLTKLRIK